MPRLRVVVKMNEILEISGKFGERADFVSRKRDTGCDRGEEARRGTLGGGCSRGRSRLLFGRGAGLPDVGAPYGDLCSGDGLRGDARAHEGDGGFRRAALVPRMRGQALDG